MKALPVLFILAAAIPFQAGGDATNPSGIAREHVANFQPEIGRWAVVNSVMKGPGAFEELHFIIETAPILDGLGVKTDWYDAGTGNFFGEVIRTYNPAAGVVDQLYFAGKRSSWSTTAQAVTFSETGYSTSFSGEDQFGAFDARSQTTYLPDEGGYDWTIERRYDGGDWFVIDQGEARPLPAADRPI
ncbi:hypothetical protein [Hyphomonas sp.]|uniref:hypothetical protein n=1 Tax=Hyphomonas sp. TaxID=87 RepID=UPI0035284C0D